MGAPVNTLEYSGQKAAALKADKVVTTIKGRPDNRVEGCKGLERIIYDLCGEVRYIAPYANNAVQAL